MSVISTPDLAPFQGRLIVGGTPIGTNLLDLGSRRCSLGQAEIEDEFEDDYD